MNSSLFKKNQFKKLCAEIDSRPQEIELIVRQLNIFYNEWYEKKENKETGEIKKYKDGTFKQRLIMPSYGRLKTIQGSIKKKILDKVVFPPNVHGGLKGKSNITNAEIHKGNKYKFTTDLLDFYPGINHKQVYAAFIYAGYTQHYAHWLTRLTTWKDQLPQGTKTSQALANLVFLKTDYILIKFCDSNNIKYTRYVDDLTFSSQQDFKFLLSSILSIITQEGFKINYRKTKYKGEQTITGIQIFNNYIDAPEKLKLKAREENITNNESKPYSIYVNSIRRRNKNMKKATKKDL